MTFSTQNYSAKAMTALKNAWNNGDSAKDCAAMLSTMLGRKISRNVVIGLVHRYSDRLGLIEHTQVQQLAKVTEARKRARVPKPKAPKAEKPFKPMMPREAKQDRRRKSAPVGVPAAGLVALQDLKDRHCRFAYGPTAPFAFCGMQVEPGSSWCSGHAAIVFDRSTSKAEQKDAA